MLKNTEEIEQEIARLLELHEAELISVHERVDFIEKQAESILSDYRRQLDKHYSENCVDCEEEQYKEEYLKAFRSAKQDILIKARGLMQKEVEEALAKVV